MVAQDLIERSTLTRRRVQRPWRHRGFRQYNDKVEHLIRSGPPGTPTAVLPAFTV